MAKIHGRVAQLWLDTQLGVCMNVTTDLTQVTFNRGKNQPETTTFGDRDTQREVDGLRDATIDVSAIFNTGGASSIITLLEDMYSGSLITRAQYMPSGSISGSPIYTACMSMTSFNVAEPVDGVVTTTFGLALASGSVTAACMV